MNDISNIKIHINATIKQALEIIDKGQLQIALVVDDNDKLLGTLTDGDIRRAFLRGCDLTSPIEPIVFTRPTVAKVGDLKKDILKIALERKLHQIPIVDSDGKIAGLQEIESLVRPRIKNNKVILMVGGMGLRLRPLTENTPKPMLEVGNKPILETIVEKFIECGYVDIVMCVNYKSNIIQEYFGNGSKIGANIEYIVEEKRMGTAGALSLLENKPKEPFFVMNGDLLTNVNFEQIMQYHLQNNAIATMCTREYEQQVPYGVVKTENEKILSIKEKPINKFFVSAGIYALSPEALKYIPNNQFFDMPNLFTKMIELNKNTISFPIREYWLDIGKIEEYRRANEEYDNVFF